MPVLGAPVLFSAGSHFGALLLSQLPADFGPIGRGELTTDDKNDSSAALPMVLGVIIRKQRRNTPSNDGVRPSR